MPTYQQITEDSPLLHDANCVYCHVDIELDDYVSVCDECRSPHHVDCWRANHNKCAMFVCNSGGALVLPDTRFDPFDPDARIQSGVLNEALSTFIAEEQETTSDGCATIFVILMWFAIAVFIVILLASV